RCKFHRKPCMMYLWENQATNSMDKKVAITISTLESIFTKVDE
ncbi:MAG: hypothetical protein ACI9VN_001920, partial [Patescibacteria group bacterium]